MPSHRKAWRSLGAAVMATPVTCPEALMAAVADAASAPQRAEIQHPACRPTGRRVGLIGRSGVGGPRHLPRVVDGVPSTSSPPACRGLSIVVPSHRKA